MADDLSAKEKLGVLDLLDTETKRIIWYGSLVAGFIFTVILPLNEIKLELKMIKENHLSHIEQSIKDINLRDEKQDTRIADICSRLDTLIGKFQANK